ncbi:MAG: DUF4394 domain-containing protein [Pararhodobacter sp.]|nr:DUF4394 domain-containing protein [Pararhodobacter sp.]
MTKFAFPATIPAAFAALLAVPAFADTAIGLAGERTLVMINLESGQVTGMTEVDYAGRLHGIDYRPATDSLIGVTEAFEVVEIDPQTGSWSVLVTMDTGMEITEGAAVIVDINPAADALRFMSGTTNHRVNLSSGAVMIDGDLTFTDGTEGMPMVGGTAYSNSFGQPDATAMYNIDTDRGALLRQTAPNDGDNAMIGALGVMFDGPVAFDIVTDADGENTAWLSANGALHTVSLEDATITGTWQIDGLDVTLRDLTVMTAMD